MYKNILLIVFFLIFDRSFKFLAIQGFLNNPINLIKDFFSLHFIANQYIAFSLPLKGLSLNILIFIILISLIIYLRKLFLINDQKNFLFLVLIFSGAVSNFYDRINYGFVIDYFDLKYFTIFNIADILIFSGVSSLILNFKNKKNETKI